MAVNFSGKRTSADDLLKKNVMTKSGTTGTASGTASGTKGQGVGINPYDETAMRIAMMQHNAKPKDDINVINPQPDDFVGPVLNPYAVKGQAQPISPGTDTGMLPAVTHEILPVDSGYTGAGQAAQVSSEWSAILGELARQQLSINGQMPTGAPTGGGAWSDLYAQMAQQQIAANAAAMGNAPSGIATGQGAWGQQYDEMIRQQMAANNGAMGNVPTGIATGQGAWGSQYDQLAQAYMEMPAYQRPAQLAGADGQETWNDTLERLAREQIETNNYMPYDPDTYDRMKATWLGKAEIAANVAAEQARQGAGGYGTSYASQLGANAYDASMQQSAADYYDQQKAAWERQRQINAQRLSIAGDMAARETDAQDRANAEALADWQRQRQVAAENMSIAGSMADREQSAADRQAQAELAAWERQQALAGQNLAYAGEMASREQSAADRQAQAELAAWERQQELAGQNLAYAGEMADRETAAAQREYENMVNAWNMRRQANADNLSVAGDMAAWDLAQQQTAAEQAQTEADAAYDRVQGLYQTLSQVYDGTNEATVRSQMRNAGYTDTEINNALNMVKNDMAAAVEDQARTGYGNGDMYDLMTRQGVISGEQAAAAKATEGKNMADAINKALSNPEQAAQLLGFDEETAASFAGMSADEQDDYITQMAGNAVLNGQITPDQYADIIKPGNDRYLESLNGKKHKPFVRGVANLVAGLMNDLQSGYITQEIYEDMVADIAQRTNITHNAASANNLDWKVDFMRLLGQPADAVVGLITSVDSEKAALKELIRLDPTLGLTDSEKAFKEKFK